MKILYLVDFFYPNKWWIEVLLSQIIGYFSEKNDVFVVTRRYDKTLPKQEKFWNAIIYRVDAKNIYDFYFKWYNFAKKFFKDVDLIHSNTFFSALIWNKLARKYNKRHIIHIHWFFWNLRNKIIKWNFRIFKFKFLEKIISNMDAEFICVSKYVYDIMKFVYWVNDKKLHLIYNWIDSKKWLSYVEDEKIKEIRNNIAFKNEFIYLFYWRNEKVKNVDMLIEAFKNAKIDNSKLILLMTDFWKNNYFKQISNNIFIYPWIEHYELPNRILASDVVVFPSITESFGYVWLETSLLEVPLIASDMWAIPEVVFWKLSFFNPFDMQDFIHALKDAKNWKFEYINKKTFEIKDTCEKLNNLYLKK